MPMGAPSNLRPAADDVREGVGRGPGLRVGGQAVDFVVGGVLNAETGFEEVADVISEVGGGARRSSADGVFGIVEVGVEVVSEVFGGMGGIGELCGEPVVFGVGRVKFCCWSVVRDVGRQGR